MMTYDRCVYIKIHLLIDCRNFARVIVDFDGASAMKRSIPS
jgi:hypothetical protein